jgi:hypothetical protein
MAVYNRRYFPRKNTENNIQVLSIPGDLNYRKDSCDLRPAKMVNQSKDGLFIECDCFIPPGSNVRIKMVSPKGYQPEDAYYMYDGRVIRCEKVADATFRFGVGIKILRKVIQARVLTSRFK